MSQNDTDRKDDNNVPLDLRMVHQGLPAGNPQAFIPGTGAVAFDAPLDAPTLGTVTAGSAQLSVALTPASVGKDIEVEYWLTSTPLVTARVRKGSNATPVVITGLTAAQYTLRARTLGNDGMTYSAWSATTTGTPS